MASDHAGSTAHRARWHLPPLSPPGNAGGVTPASQPETVTMLTSPLKLSIPLVDKDTIMSPKSAKYTRHLSTVRDAVATLDALPKDPDSWTPEQDRAGATAILTLGAAESFLRRYARADLAAKAG